MSHQVILINVNMFTEPHLGAMHDARYPESYKEEWDSALPVKETIQ